MARMVHTDILSDISADKIIFNSNVAVEPDGEGFK